MKTPIAITLREDRLASAICSGIESGIGYWAQYVRHTAGDPSTLADVAPSMRGYYGPLRSGFIMLRDADTKQIHRLDRAAIQRGVQVVFDRYPRHVAGLCGFEQDAITGDVLIQCAIFGELVYG